MLMNSFNLKYFIQAPSPNIVTWRLGLQYTNLHKHSVHILGWGGGGASTIQHIAGTKARHIVLKLLKEKKNINLYFCWLFRNKTTLSRVSQSALG